jgi:hypothetical protein
VLGTEARTDEAPKVDGSTDRPENADA